MTNDATHHGTRFRRGTLDDVERLAVIQFQSPSREAVTMAGTAAAAKAFRAELLTRTLRDDAVEVIVLDLDGEAVGFAELSTEGVIPPLKVIARCAIRSMGFIGALTAGWRALARNRVEFEAPDGTHLVELQVAPEHRNCGFGALLLAEVERRAEERQVTELSLTTAIDNPARHLYERAGFTVEAEKRNRRYESITGSPGRVLMVKRLRTQPVP
jgi:ribosomal protein S18 acetylase RimI-like enzyme